MKKVLCDTNVFIKMFNGDIQTSNNIPLYTYNVKDFRFMPGIQLYDFNAI
jgi:predicted nucleic acid-binding protein